VIEALVAETALLTALIGQTIKLRWKLSLQVRGKGPARLIATDYYGPTEDGEPARIRAYASYDADRLDRRRPVQPDRRGLFRRDDRPGRRHGALPGLHPHRRWLAFGLRRDLFRPVRTDSHPLPAAYGESAEPGRPLHWRAGGIMLQHMPAVGGVAAEQGSGEGGLLTHADILGGAESETGTAPTFCSTRSRSWR
jgi:molecular chaperone Hsp33